MFSRSFIAFLLLPFFLIVLSAPAFAQGSARLKVCNTGKAPVEVAVATTNGTTERTSTYWIIKGQTIAAEECAVVYDQSGSSQVGRSFDNTWPPGEALVGFGLKDSSGRFVSLKATSVPDFGVYFLRVKSVSDGLALQGKQNTDVLSPASRTLCVDPVRTPAYRTEDINLFAASDCAQFRAPGVSRAVPLTTAYDFFLNGYGCDVSLTLPANCPPGGDYYLNIAANPMTSEVDVTGAEAGNEDHPSYRSSPQEKAALDALKKEFEDAVKEGKEAGARRTAAADPMNSAATARAEVEARQNSIDSVSERTRNIGRIRDLSQFTPDWLRTTEPMLYVRGTVSRVEPPSGPRQPARLYFKESPDNGFVACIPAPAIFDNLQQYAGKYLEVRGRVSQSNCGGRVGDVQIVNPAMIHDLANGTPVDEAALPGMTVSPPLNKGGPNVWVAPPPGRDRNDRPPQPSPAMAAVPSSAATTAASPIPAGTHIDVTLLDPVDMTRAKDGDTFRAQVLRAATPAGGNVLSAGSAVLLRFARTPAPTLTLQSLTLNGRPISVSSDPFGLAASTAYRAGMRLFFVVSAAR